ncbi:T-complex protein 1 subunit theta [Spraguea lophii 42_110]|uniref:T-complex protein 1 subunit theta n=1 Tax=Spraguea lophii (strain 42_110) TaxID=1358809 RepID=S7XL29_SPRLO|nr:T-complex protein 1 subunit theta [Spraguea lophii 42_110]
MFGSSYSSLISSKLSHSSTKLINKTSKLLSISKSLETSYYNREGLKKDEGFSIENKDIEEYNESGPMVNTYTKLMVNNYNNIILSSLPTVILNNIKLVDPLQLLIKDKVEELDVYGDCCGYMVLLFSRLLNYSRELVLDGLNITQLVDILREVRQLLYEKCDDYKIKEIVDYKDKKILSKILKGVMQSETLENLLVEAISRSNGKDLEFLDDIRINKVSVGVLKDSYLMEGMVFDGEPAGTVKGLKIENKPYRTAIYNCPLDISRTETKGTLLFQNADDLESFSTKESTDIKSLVDKIASNDDLRLVIVSGETEPRHLDYFNKKNIMVFKVQSKFDIRRVRKMLGGTLSLTLNELRDEHLGRIKGVRVYREGGRLYTQLLPYNSDNTIHTIVLKDSLKANTDEYERMIDKGIRVLKKNIYEEDDMNKILLTEGAGIFENRISKLLNERSAEFKDIRKMVYNKLSLAFGEFNTNNKDKIYDIFTPKIKATLYAIDILCNVLLTEDILISKGEDMQVRPPTGNWDNH